ncbi:hypothetical protein KY289_008111 [Solanum tuberosum]|nr:hypothetical protein KY289_008111 [Solanum tuberosum]
MDLMPKHILTGGMEKVNAVGARGATTWHGQMEYKTEEEAMFKLCLGETVSYLISTMNMNNTNPFGVDMMANKVKVHDNMLHTSMEDMILA